MTYARRPPAVAAATYLAIVALSFCPGCATRRGAPAPTTNAALSGHVFDRPELGVRLAWPAGWAKRPSPDFVLLLTPDNGRNDASISLDVPKLPPHIPGLIPIGSVRGGYLDDLRDAVGPLETINLAPPAIPDAAERLVRSSWTDARGVPHQETALLLVHDDSVYILRGRSPIADEPTTRTAFNEIVRSLEWVKNRPGPASQPAA
jgi:hypothetical protein